MRKRTTGRRRAISIATAIALHALVLALLVRVRVHEVHAAPSRIVITFAHPDAPSSSHLELTPPPAPTTSPPQPHAPDREPPTPPTPSSSPTHESGSDESAAGAPSAHDAPSDAHAQESAPEKFVDSTGHIFMPENAPHAVHHDVIDDSIRGASALDGPQPSLATLEAGSDLKVPGPESDSQRIARTTREDLERSISEHDVARGLADDWFRRRKGEIERLWKPNEKELTRGGREVTAEALALRTLTNPLLWNEANHDIAADASHVADLFDEDRSSLRVHDIANPAQTPLETDEERRARIRKAAGTYNGAFKTTFGVEVSVHHRADGSVEAVLVERRSGASPFDDGAVDAIARAFALDADDHIPARVANGGPFVTRWILDAQWELLVPKCSYMASGNNAQSLMSQGVSLPVGCGTSFGPDGVDVPFTVKKSTRVELVSIQKL